MNKVIYKGFTRSQMIDMIYLETDTCSWCLEASDKELIEGFVEIFAWKFQAWETTNQEQLK